MYKSLITIFVLLGMISFAISGNIRPGTDQTSKKGYRPGVLVVKYKSSTPINNIKSQKNSKTVSATGISSLDLIHKQANVISISKDELYQPKDKNLAKNLGIDRTYILKVPETTDIEALARTYAADANVESANPDWEVYPQVIPNDPNYSKQWGHNNTAQMPSYNWSTNLHNGPLVGTVGFDANAEAAWDNSQGYGSSSVVIAIIDGGVEWAHPDLAANIWTNPGESGGGKETNGIDDDGNGKIDDYHGWDFGVGDNNPNDDASGAGHGTCCAGVAAAVVNNSVGVAGIAGGSKILPCKVANAAGTMYFSAISSAITYAADIGADVISMSLGGTSSDAATQTACTYAWNKGTVVLAATGNENKSTISYPAAMTNVIGVGAASNCGDRKRSSNLSTEVNLGVSTDPNGYTCDGERWWGSNYGVTTKDAATAVDVIAPTILPTTDRVGANGYDATDYDLYFNGTSCSTPYAAGVCALIISKNPTWTATQVRDQLCSTAIDISNVESGAGWDRYTGYGEVDAAAATAGAAGPSVTVTSPNGAENWITNSVHNITWTFTGTIANVMIEYTTDGTTYSTVVATTPNTGTYSWTVPNTPSTTSKVRVSDVTNSATNDVSNANFTISVPDVIPPLISNVQAINISSNSATITWTTDESSNSVVNYGLTTGYGSSASNATMVTAHSVTLTALSMNTTYHYAVSSTDASNNTATSVDYTFTTTNSMAPIETFADGNFTANPVWAGSTTSFQVVANSDAGAGATGSNTLRLSAAAAGTFYLRTQRTASWGTEQSWSFWMGRRAQAATSTNYSVVWLWANEATLTSTTVDGYRILFGDNSGGDNLFLQRVTNGVATTILTSTGTVTNGITDYGFLVRVTRTTGSVWNIYTSILPTASGTGVVASTQPTAANTTVNQGSVTNSTYTVFTNGYFGFGATASSGSSARQAAEFDQLYFDVSATSPLSKAAVSAPVVTESNVNPTEFKLNQNYPNPFNPSTTLSFDLAEDAVVTLKVYDVIGQEIAVLMNNEDRSAGTHQIRFDASSLSSGVYYCKLNASTVTGKSFADTKRLMLVK
ncbi:MAG: S8 family serine peptidase [Ignavibacteriales bacterium]|nr:S8 family serine peptidase [Ignavibacteriales bacterium]